MSLDSVIVDMPRTRSPSATLSSGGDQTHLSFAANPSATASAAVMTQKSTTAHHIEIPHTLSMNLESGSGSLEPYTPDDPEKR